MTGAQTGAAPLYDPFDPVFHQDPYPSYRRLRDEDPVHRTPRGYWVLSRFEDVFGPPSIPRRTRLPRG